MLAIHQNSYDKYGCPNCGCDTSIRDNFYSTDQAGGICRGCNLHFYIIADGYTQKDIRMSFGTNRKDDNGKNIYEKPILIEHPRIGIDKWHYELPDVRPDIENAEFFKSRGIGYDLAGFVKCKQAGERILNMVKDVLDMDQPKSYLDYREYEPFRIQFKFQKEEFNLNMLDSLVTKNNNILTKDILIQCKI